MQELDGGAGAVARGSQAVERVLSILTTFTMEEPNLTLVELSKRTGLNIATARRMVKALQKAGFLTQHPTVGSYTVGPTVLGLSRIVTNSNSEGRVVAVCRRYLDELRNACGESVGLHMSAGVGRFCVAEAESRHMMRMSTGVGTEFPWYAGAASKVLLAGMTPEEREDALHRVEWRAITDGTPRDPRRLLNELILVAERGFATSFGETVEGASALAMAIRGPDHRVIAAINITGTQSRWTESKMTAFLPHLHATVREIEDLLGLVEGG